MSYTINVSLPATLAKKAKEKVDEGYYSSFSELVRAGIRALIKKEEVPTFVMSKKAEEKALRALKDYEEGKAIEIKSFKELED